MKPMTNKLLAASLAIVVGGLTLQAQQQAVDPALQQLVDQIKLLNDAAQKLVTPPPAPVCTDPKATNLNQPLPCQYPLPPANCTDPAATNTGQPIPCQYPVPNVPTTIYVAPTDNIQAAVDQAPAGSTIMLEPGATYTSALVVKDKPGASVTKRLTITTRGWKMLDHAPAPSDVSKQAHIQVKQGGNTNTAVQVLGNFVDLVGVNFQWMPPYGTGDMLLLGPNMEPDPTKIPKDVRVMQCTFTGQPGSAADYGAKRGINVAMDTVLIDQIACYDVWKTGQDSQCVSGYSGASNVTVRRSYISSGSEPIMFGGSPSASSATVPHDILIEDNIFHHPAWWKADEAAAPAGSGRKRQIKNLLEMKTGKRITIRRNLLKSNWAQAQSGFGVQFTMATNGTCPWCELTDILFEDNVIVDTQAGINLIGWTYDPNNKGGAGQLQNVTIRNNYLYTTGGAADRALQIGNVSGRHNIVIDHNTIVNRSNNWFVGYFGTVFPTTELTPVKGGPMSGLTITNNVFTKAGRYSFNGPEGSLNGTGIKAFAPDAVIGGNVFGDVLAADLTRLNEVAGTAGPNVNATEAELLQKITATACGTYQAGKGADCERLKPAFALLPVLNALDLDTKPVVAAPTATARKATAKR